MPNLDLVALWEAHCRYEFETRDVDATMATMTAEPYVNHVPTLTGGVGHDQLKRFYKYHFIGGKPAGHRARAHQPHGGRGPDRGRDAVQVHPHQRGGLDAAGREAHRQAG